MKRMRKIISLIVCVSMMVASAATAASVFAATYPVINPTQSIASRNPDTAENSLSMSKTAATTGNDNEYKITFSMPKQDSVLSKTIAVAFYLDKSSVNDVAGLQAAANDMLDDMKAAATADSNVTFNVGAVVSNYNVIAKTSGLLNIEQGTNLTDIEGVIGTSGGAGSSIESGILIAKDWLENTTADAKYMINLTDYAGYILGDGSDMGLMRYHTNGTSRDEEWNGQYWKADRYSATAVPGYMNSTAADIRNFIANKVNFNGVISSDILTKKGPEAYEYPVGSAASITAADCITNTISDDPTTPTMFEKSMYWVGNDLLDAKAEGIQIISVVRPYHSPSSGSYTPGLYEVNQAFQKWVAEDIGTVYTESTPIDDSFAQISSEVLFQMGRGEVTDVVGSYFNYVTGSVDITIDGASYPAELVAENHWGFDKDAYGQYAYEVRYDVATKTFKWNINRPIEKTKYVYFSYKVNVDEEKAQALGVGDYDLQTNGDAHVDYMTSQEVKQGATEYTKHVTLNSPVVRYNIAGGIAPDDNGDIIINKKWSATPTNASVKFDIYESGSKIDTVTMDASSGWTMKYYVGTASNAIISLASIEEASPAVASPKDSSGSTPLSRKFTVIEQAVSGYTTTYAYDEAAHSVTVTNTKKPSSSSSSSSSSSESGSSSVKRPNNIVQTPTQTPEVTPIPETEIPAGNIDLPKTGEERMMVWAMFVELIVMVGAAFEYLKKEKIN